MESTGAEKLRQAAYRRQSGAARMVAMFLESGAYALPVEHDAQTVTERARVEMANAYLPDIGPRYRQ